MTWSSEVLAGNRPGGAKLAVRNIPKELLDWGPHQRPPSVDRVAQWMVSGRQLPNIVLFAPVMAKAFGLYF